MHFQISKTLNINSTCSRFDHLVLEVHSIGSKMHFQPKVYLVLEVHKIGSKMHFHSEVYPVLEVHKFGSKMHFQPEVYLQVPKFMHFMNQIEQVIALLIGSAF